MYSILAGVMIGIGAITYLSIGGVAGALLFAVGLMTICHFQLHLFTGKAGLLASHEINSTDLTKIWFGNLIGTGAVSGLMSLTPRFDAISKAATAIIATRMANGSIANLILGIFCGMLMYIAVTGYKEKKDLFFVYIPVGVFILCGFNHCVADMFYGWSAIWSHWSQPFEFALTALIPTTVGNIIGCNIIPFVRRAEHHH